MLSLILALQANMFSLDIALANDVNDQVISSKMSYSIDSKINIDWKIHDIKFDVWDELKNKWIDTLLSVGYSDFGNSVASRIQNIEAAVKKFDWKIIPKDWQFSFNEIIGNMTTDAWFTKDAVIKGWRIVYEQWGWVCQLSTTLVRSALNAWLKMVHYRNHSIAIPYYKPYWLDSAIYSPYLDLKFINNTPSDIYMSVFIIDTKLIALFYWTNDWRAVSFKGPYVNKNITVDNYRHPQNLASIGNFAKKLDYKKFKITYVRVISHEFKKDEVEVFNSFY